MTNKIKYHAFSNHEDWLQAIARQMNVSIVDNRLELPPNYGEGFFKHYYPFELLSIFYLKFKLKKPLELYRQGIANKPLFPILFYLDEAEQFTEGNHYQLHAHKPNGIFMPSPATTNKIIFPPKKWIAHIALTVHKKYLMNEFVDENSYLYNLLKKNEPFFIFESFTSHTLRLFQQIEKRVASSNKTDKLLLYAESLELLESFLRAVNNRSQETGKVKIHADDIDSLFKVREIILQDVSDIPNVSALAESAGMSISKLQKSFKQVFGKTISQYALHEKMQIAKDMLASKKYNVSEVGCSVGYTNLSHFSETFRKHFEVNPKDFLDSL